MMHISLLPEETFILLCCCIATEEERTKRIDELLLKDLDWDYIIGIAVRHGVSNLIYNCILETGNRHTIPDAVFNKLKTIYYNTAYVNLVALKEFNAMLAAFNKVGIRMIPLKGIDLLRTVYPANIALRVFSDVDVLVKKSDLDPAVQQLRQFGYSEEKSAHKMEELFHLVYSKTENKRKIFIEVHWDVDVPKSPHKINIDDLWTRAEPVTIENQDCYRLSLEDNLLFSAFHILRAPLNPGSNSIISLKNLCDVAEIIKINNSTLNWEIVFNRAQQYNITRPVYLVFVLLEQLFNISIPGDLFEEITRVGFREEMVNQLIQVWIFDKNNDDIFLPGTIGASVSREKITKKINLFNILKTFYIVVRHQVKTAPSLLTGSQRTLWKIRKSLLNYIKLFYSMLCDYKTTSKFITNKIINNKELEEIEKWLRYNS